MSQSTLIPSKIFEREHGQISIREIFEKNEINEYIRFDSKEDRSNTKKQYRIPIHQRFNKWTNSDKEDLIESIFMNYIIGAISLSRHVDDTSFYFDIEDGQSRLTVIQEFLEDKFRFKGLLFSELDDIYKNRILGYNFRTEITSLPQTRSSTTNIDIHYYENFDRINRGKKLSDNDKYWCYKDKPLVKFCINLMKTLKSDDNYNFMKLSNFLKIKDGVENRNALESFVTMTSAIINGIYKKSFSRHIDYLGNYGEELTTEDKNKVIEFLQYYLSIKDKVFELKGYKPREQIPFENPGKFLSLIIMDYNEDVNIETEYRSRTKEEKILMWARLINTDRVSENFMYKGQQTLWTGLTDGDKRNQEKCNIEKRLIRCIQFHDGNLAYSDMDIQYNILDNID